ncbi:hypothetical protein QBC44DRAFT_370440 [Cladorrhinum sp. PSN332]|nr:hypothetical protein QBC44DRAFT_370440 [Cladorrhinum sp. PSN332]
MATIRDLPLEMIQAIIGFICPRCNQRSRRSMRAVHTLVDLCRTSKLLNQVATPHLYHRPPLHKWPLLARTLIARPDLAGHAKQLLVPWETPVGAYDWVTETWPTSGFPHEVVAYRDALVQQLNLDAQQDYMSILASLCPNLEKLEIEDDLSFTGPHIPFCRPKSLQRLKKVKLMSSRNEWLGGGHGGGFKHIVPLLNAAPNIQRLTVPKLTDCTGLDGLTVASLTHLDIVESALPAQDFAALLAACPNLEILEYECGFASWMSTGYNVGEYDDARSQQFTPVQVRDAILEHAKNLQCFRFNIKLLYEDEEPKAWQQEGMFELLREAMESRGIEYEFLEGWETGYRYD